MPAMLSALDPRIMSIADMPVPAPNRIHNHAIAMTAMRAATTTWRSRRRTASRTVSATAAVIAPGGRSKPAAERGDRSGAFPVERDVLGRIEGVVELEAM